jgi:hypothetical protein
LTIIPFTRITSVAEHNQFIISSSNIAIEMSTFFGGDRDDTGVDVIFDNDGNIIIVGSTRSDNFPTTNPIQAERAGNDDAFVAILDLIPNETPTTPLPDQIPLDLLFAGTAISLAALVIIVFVYIKKKK